MTWIQVVISKAVVPNLESGPLKRLQDDYLKGEYCKKKQNSAIEILSTVFFSESSISCN